MTLIMMTMMMQGMMMIGDNLDANADKDDSGDDCDGDLCFIFSTKVCRLDLQSRWEACFLILVNETARFVSSFS